MKQNVCYADRKTGKIVTESVMGDGMLRFAYETLLGRSLWCCLFRTGFLSRLMGAYYNTGLSRRSIGSLTAIPGLNAEEAEKCPCCYSSFNDFFARHLKPGARPADMAENVLISPADGRLLVFPSCGAEDAIPVKGAKRTLNHLCCCALPEKSYAVAVVRLAPVDYHRYHYPCACRQNDAPQVVRGCYHSVNPIALAKRPDLFVENTRQITKLESPVFGDFYYIEVGAFGVGSIIQTSTAGEHKKMDEKGYFTFGGSTVILVMPSEKIQFDADLLANSAKGIETRILCGERLGVSK